MSTVSVIIPCYNGEAFLGQTIASVLSQTYADLQLVIVNDGSTDGTEGVVRQFNDPRIVYHAQANAGVANARNKGMALATGKYIAFLDADDLYFPDNLAEKVQFLRNNPEIPVVHAQEVKFASLSGRSIEVITGKGGWVLTHLLEMSGTVIHSPSSVVMTKELADRLRGFDSQLSTSADWEYWVRIALQAPIGFIPKPLTGYRVHDGQMHLNIDKMEKDMHYAFEKLLGLGAFQDQAHYKRCYGRLALILSACYWGDAGNYSKSAKYLVRSLLNHPAHLVQKVLHKVSVATPLPHRR
jgi:glycosyltransferase involved in cell wall biosynthesis